MIWCWCIRMTFAFEFEFRFNLVLWRCAYVTWSSSSTHTTNRICLFVSRTHIHASHANQIESFLYLHLAIFEPVLLSVQVLPAKRMWPCVSVCVCEAVCVLGFMQISILIVAIVLRMSTCAHSIATACECVWVSVCSLTHTYTHTYTHTHAYVWLSPPHTHTHNFSSSSLTSTFRKFFEYHGTIWLYVSFVIVVIKATHTHTYSHSYKQRALAQRKENCKSKSVLSFMNFPTKQTQEEEKHLKISLAYLRTHPQTHTHIYTCVFRYT